MIDAVSVPIGTFDKAEARALTDEVKADAHSLWGKLLRLYEGKAHLALEYTTWGAYYEAEFGGSQSMGKKLLTAGRVLEALDPPGFRGDDDPGSPLLHESTARELQPLLRNGARAVQEAWEETVEQHGPEPTAKQVREVVKRRQAPPKPAPVRQPSWVARVTTLSDELRFIVFDSPDERAEHASQALSLFTDVQDDLRKIASDEPF